MLRAQVSPEANGIASSAVLATAMRRLALIRARTRGDWSDGPASLPQWANADGEDVWSEIELQPETMHDAAPEPPLELRGRFESVDADADTSWIDLAHDPVPATPEIPEGATSVQTSHAAPVAAAAAMNAFLSRLPAAPATPEAEPPPGYGALPDTLALLEAPTLAPKFARRAPAVSAPDAPDVAPAPAAGADAGLLALLAMLATDNAAAPVRSDVAAPTDEAPDALLAFGAAPLASLLAVTPPAVATQIVTRSFDPASLVDDMIADAFDALCETNAAIPADDLAWDIADLPAESALNAILAAIEHARWDLPRHRPCIDTFAATPNHETAVRLTRTLRLRAQALEARAFAEGTDFGALVAEGKDTAFWFAASALTGASPAGDDASFPDWCVNADGLVVVTAPDIAPRRAPTAPLISEEELDALFERVEESRRVVLDDLGDDEAWSEPYWSDVDAYLAQIGEDMDPAILDAPHPLPQIDMLDIEIRDPPPPRIPATHFWLPGDDDLVVCGEGDDLFIVGAGDDAATILVEDGATWSMRTGGAARMDEAIVSLSHSPWTNIDAMTWRRIAVLCGVAQVRVEQNARGNRRLAIAGMLGASGLDGDAVRLVRSGDDGEEDFPAMRPASAWTGDLGDPF